MSATDTPHRSWVVPSLLLTAILILIDQATKRLAEVQLVPAGRVVDLPGPVDLRLLFNAEGANGLPLPSVSFILVPLVIVAIAARRLPRARFGEAMALALLLGGGLGNFLDRVLRMGGPGESRFFHGSVVDFVKVGNRPVFNAADVFITLGVVVLVIAVFREERATAAAQLSDPSAMTDNDVLDPEVGLPPVGGWTLVGVLITLGVVLLDQATKLLAFEQLGDGRRVELPGPFTLSLTFNDGAAFSTKAPAWVFIVVTVVVLVLVLRTLPKVRWPSHAVAYGLLLGGALGNFVDRVARTGDVGDPRYFNGHVVDFIASARFPTFNVADIAITFGFVVLVIFMYRTDLIEERASGHEQDDR